MAGEHITLFEPLDEYAGDAFDMNRSFKIEHSTSSSLDFGLFLKINSP
jgi:hypothetical protein